MRRNEIIGSSSSFTLIEMVVIIFIMGIIGLISLHLLANSAGVYTMLLAQRRADGEVFDAVERIRRESRTLRNNVIASSTNWSFVNDRTVAVQLAFSPGSITLNGNKLAGDVAFFEFRYFDVANKALNAPVSGGDLQKISRVQLSLRVTNSHASAENIVNMHLLRGYRK